jgi:hypothetical protein
VAGSDTLLDGDASRRLAGASALYCALFGIVPGLFVIEVYDRCHDDFILLLVLPGAHCITQERQQSIMSNR